MMTKQDILQKYAPTQDNLIAILHDIQNSNPQQYLETKDLDIVANYLNLTKSSVYGLAKYYTMFSLTPRGKFIIRLCASPVCKLAGAWDLISELKNILGINVNETTEDGLFTLELVECLGRCAVAPSVIVNEQPYDNLTKEKLSQIISEKREEAKREG